MKIEIADDFDLAKITDCGQAFRAKELQDGLFRFITGKNVLYIKKIKECEYEISCDRDTWDEAWVRYFDLDRDYAGIRKSARGVNPLTDNAIEAGRGIRILKQDEWEMLVSFIISQRKSIPAIRTSIEKLALCFGEKIETQYETIYTFPDAKALCQAKGDILSTCSLGYRLEYVRAAAEAVYHGDIDLYEMRDMDNETLFETLLKLRGVGKKVANCVMLFGYGRVDRAPVDVWIQRAIEDCGDDDIFEAFGGYAGIMQQYVFYYRRYVYEQMA